MSESSPVDEKRRMKKEEGMDRQFLMIFDVG
jgi:hypothetical protein